MTILLTIDGKQVEAEKESTILEVAKREGIEIPTLCHHEALKPYGVCRLCVVEVRWGKGSSSLVPACIYPIEEPMDILTDTEKIRKARKLILELLLARSPNSEYLQELARAYGIEKTRLKPKENTCILCGLCTRVCNEVIGKGAVNFAQRGARREISTPFHLPSEDCIGCGTCAMVCPTNSIHIEDEGDERILHTFNTRLKLQACSMCGKYFAPIKEVEFLKERVPFPSEWLYLCEQCRGFSLNEKLTAFLAGKEENLLNFSKR